MKEIINSVRQWLEVVVLEFNLCPFAKRELVNDHVHFCVTQATTEEQLLESLEEQLNLLNNDTSIETSLLIHPYVLQDFYDYNQFLSLADGLLVEMNLEGIYQIASFHPGYQFSDTSINDAENYTNRSPYPLLHLLREDSLERAIKSHANVDQIALRNIELMNRLGTHKLKSILESCLPSNKTNEDNS